MKYMVIALLVFTFLSFAPDYVRANENTAAVAGYVYDAEGNPIEEAIVEFRFILKHQAREGLISATVLTNRDGKYYIAGLPVARGWAKATVPGRGYDAFEVKLDSERVNIINFKL
jgi:hypothetical protein